MDFSVSFYFFFFYIHTNRFYLNYNTELPKVFHKTIYRDKAEVQEFLREIERHHQKNSSKNNTKKTDEKEGKDGKRQDGKGESGKSDSDGKDGNSGKKSDDSSTSTSAGRHSEKVAKASSPILSSVGGVAPQKQEQKILEVAICVLLFKIFLFFIIARCQLRRIRSRFRISCFFIVYVFYFYAGKRRKFLGYRRMLA